MSKLRLKLWAYTLFFFQALFVQPIKRLRHLGQKGETRFLESYGTEGYLPLPAAARDRRWHASRCVGCGLCDAACDTLAPIRRGVLPALSALPLAYSRSMHDYAFAAPALDALGACEGCAACEAVCPTGVPLKEIVDAIREDLARRPGALPSPAAGPAPEGGR